MAWNEGDKDPWSGRKKKQGPPDLDQLFKQFVGKFLKTKKTNPATTEPVSPKHYTFFAMIVVLVLVIIWLLSGVYVVEPAEEAVVLRFGNYLETQGSGLHWFPRFIESKTIVNVQEVYNISYESSMLTEDENIVSVELAVQYRISDPFAFLYNVTNPIQSLQQATASAIRQVVGHTNLDQILTTERQLVTEDVATQLRATLAVYQTGIDVLQVTLQSTKPPEEVTDAFNDAIKAREDEQRYQNQAQAYASDVVPIAQGFAKRLYTEAGAYKQQVVLDAKAQVAPYLALLPAYEKSPAVMRDRLYLSTMQNVLTHTNKVFLTNPNKNIVYLPLNDLLKSGIKETIAAAAPLSIDDVPPAIKTTTRPVYQGGYFSGGGAS